MESLANLPCTTDKSRVGLFELCRRLTGQKEGGGAWKNARVRNAKRGEPLFEPETIMGRVFGARKETPTIDRKDVPAVVHLVALRPEDVFNDPIRTAEIETYAGADAVNKIKKKAMASPSGRPPVRSWEEPEGWRSALEEHYQNVVKSIRDDSLVLATRAQRSEKDAGTSETAQIITALQPYGIVDWPLYSTADHNSSGQVEQEPLAVERKAVCSVLEGHRQLLEKLAKEGRLILVGKAARLVLNAFLDGDIDVPCIEYPCQWYQWPDGRPDQGIGAPYKTLSDCLGTLQKTFMTTEQFSETVRLAHSKCRTDSNKSRWKADHEGMRKSLGDGNRSARQDPEKGAQWHQRLIDANYENEDAQARKSSSWKKDFEKHPEKRKRLSDLAKQQHVDGRFGGSPSTTARSSTEDVSPPASTSQSSSSTTAL